MTAPTITQTRISAAMRLVDAGAKPVRLRDQRMAGLSILVGKRTTRWQVEFKVALPDGGWSAGRRLVLGDFPEMGHDEAREAAAAAKKLVAKGIDPTLAKKARREANIDAAASRTVGAAIERFIRERGQDWTSETSRAFRRDLGLIEAEIGAAPMALVNRDRLVDLVASLIFPDGSGVGRAVRVATLLSALWKQAGPGGGHFPGWGWPIDHNVGARIPVPGKHRLVSRSRVLDEREIHDLWPVLVRPGPYAAHRLVLAISLATGLRIGAIALLDIADVDLDPVPIVGARDCGPTLTIRAADGRKFSSRERREGTHLILPISQFTVSLFRRALALRAESDDGGPHLFQARYGPLRSAGVSDCWATLVRQGLVPADVVAHDLRRSMRSHLGELDHGGSWEDEERLLGHKVGNAVSRTYDRGRRLARLRPVIEAWGQRLQAIVSAPAAEVVAIRGSVSDAD